MTHYSYSPANVRVDFFKPQGKWYETEQMVWLTQSSWDNPADIIKEFHMSLIKLLQKDYSTMINPHKFRYHEMWAVCPEPYHPHGFPLMIKINDDLDRGL